MSIKIDKYYLYNINNICNEIIKLKGEDIKIINVSKKIYFIDYMIICTATSKQHVKSISNTILKKFNKNKNLNFIEKDKLFEWIILDLSNIIIHIMQINARNFYLIDNLWNSNI